MANNQTLFIEKGQGKFFSFDAVDIDGDTLDYIIVASPATGTVYNFNDGSFGLDAPNDEGVVIIQYKVNEHIIFIIGFYL